MECKLGLEKLGSPTAGGGEAKVWLLVSHEAEGGHGVTIIESLLPSPAAPCSSNRGAGPALSLGLVDKGEWTI